MDDTSLLITKIHFPLARHTLVSRPRLVEQLKQGLRGPLTLISGSAGSGKTTLMSEWRTNAGRNVPSAWLSLDERDNDVQIFLAYLSTSLDGIQSGLKNNIHRILHSPNPLAPEIILTTLINSVSSISSNFVLVLDDYQVITNPEVHAAISFLVENLPCQMHLVILTRIDPPLPLARLRSRGDLVELRDKELRFTIEEVAFFLKQVMQLDLTDEQVAALETRTEGWIAGLQLAALSMQGRQDLAGFIAAFTGSHRYVIDYLTDEVLNRQPQDVLTFLLKTAILERLSGSLCNALTGGVNSQLMLEQLESANLFIVPLDDERKWFRYHQLFADLLRNRLQQILPGQTNELHLKASQWYEAQGYIESALQHAAALPDQGLLVNILTRHAIWMIDHGYTRLVNRWLNRLPQEMVVHNPVLGICMSICAHHIPPRDLARSEEWLQKAESALASQAVPVETANNLRENIAANRINLARMADAPPEYILELIADTLARFPDLSPKRSAFIYFNEATAHLSLHNLLAATEAFERIQAIGRLEEDPYDQLAGLSKLIDLHAKQGNFMKAEQLCLPALVNDGLAGVSPASIDPVCGFIDVSYGEIMLFRGELKLAKDHLELGNSRLSATGEIAAQARALIDLARLSLYQGNQEEAYSSVEAIDRLQSKFSQPAKLLFWLHQSAQNHSALDEVERLLTESPFLPEANTDLPGVLLREERRFYTQLVQAYAYIVLFREKRVSDLDPVITFLEKQKSYSITHGWKIRLAQLLGTHSLALDALGEPVQAHETVINALTLASSFGGMGTFLDLGMHFQILLDQMAPANAELAVLIKKFQMITARPVQPFANPVKQDELIESLTERELDVLHLMAAGLSNPEIARELFLTLNTIKTHTRGIFSKLGVSNRTQATVRARELGLV